MTTDRFPSVRCVIELRAISVGRFVSQFRPESPSAITEKTKLIMLIATTRTLPVARVYFTTSESGEPAWSERASHGPQTASPVLDSDRVPPLPLASRSPPVTAHSRLPAGIAPASAAGKWRSAPTMRQISTYDSSGTRPASPLGLEQVADLVHASREAPLRPPA